MAFWWDGEAAAVGGLALRCVGDWNVPAKASRDGASQIHDCWMLSSNALDYGEQSFQADGAWFRRASGLVTLIRPGVAAFRRGTRGKEGRGAFIGFHHGEAAGLDRLVGESGAAFFHDPGFLVNDCLARANELARGMGADSGWRVLGVLCDIAGLLHAATPQADGGALVVGWGPAVAFAPLREFLSLNLERRLSLKEMAAAVGMSVSSLTHRYAALMGETPRETHLKMRLERACDLLLMGEPVKAVAARLGFANTPHFSSVFKERFAATPAEFRERRRAFP